MGRRRLTLPLIYDVKMVDFPERKPKPAPWRPATLHCPGCDRRFAAAVGPQPVYCGPRCKLEAKFVRYERVQQARWDGQERPEDVRKASEYKFAHALGGTYNENRRRIPRQVQIEVWRRAGNRCEKCGDPGAEIDHKRGDSNDLSNLQLLCKPCHHLKTGRHLVPLETAGAATKARAARLRLRVMAPRPLLPCDQPGWDYREWQRRTAS